MAATTATLTFEDTTTVTITILNPADPEIDIVGGWQRLGYVPKGDGVTFYPWPQIKSIVFNQPQ